MMKLKDKKMEERERMPLPLVGASEGFGGSAILKSVVDLK
jgi:hypothetical protein